MSMEPIRDQVVTALRRQVGVRPSMSASGGFKWYHFWRLRWPRVTDDHGCLAGRRWSDRRVIGRQAEVLQLYLKTTANPLK